MPEQFSLGIDFGTNSVRALIVDTADGREIASAATAYRRGENGIVLDSRNPDLARQHPRDHVDCLIDCVREALSRAQQDATFRPEAIIGIGVDATGSTPLPVDKSGMPLAFNAEFENDANAMAWLWKDHTSHAEAEEITQLARRKRPAYLEKCGGKYSSEWFWAKLLHCRRVAPKVVAAAESWVELTDWVTGFLTGTQKPSDLRRAICPAGHKALFHRDWRGYPDEEFLQELDPELARIRRSLPDSASAIGARAGDLAVNIAEQLGLPAGIPVSVGALDAHMGAVGSGIQPGVLVQIVGTSTCDMMIAPLSEKIPLIPGLCGVVPESILPGYYGFEAGQSAVGDLFNWWVSVMQPGGGMLHEDLTHQATALKPGESGLLALDWHSGNRTILVDPRLSGMILGLSLHTKPAEVYRALIEATAFGVRRILERFEEYGVTSSRVINCGGISAKNALFMQTYADVLGRPMELSASQQTCALGSAIAGAVVGGAHASFDEAIGRMAHLDSRRFTPDPSAAAVYDRLYALYCRLHDAFGVRDYQDNLFDVMKELLEIRDEARAR